MSLGATYEQISNVLAAIHEGGSNASKKLVSYSQKRSPQVGLLIFSVPGIHCFP